MAKLNILINLNTYSDSKSTNAPNLSNFKWNREIGGINAENPVSQVFTIPAGQSKTLFTGSAIKKIVYLETNLLVNMVTNGTITEQLKPIIVNSAVFPGISIKTSDITSIVVSNPSLTDDATIFLATVE